jgi:uridylate kinase
MPDVKPKYRRVMLKISGEGFCKEGGQGIDGEELSTIASEIADVAKLGVQLAVVVGGGNFIRGTSAAVRLRVHEATAHYMGMLSTVINALALQDTLEGLGLVTRVQSAIAVESVCEKFIRRRGIHHLEKGRTVVLAAGTGNPFVTTDTCAALRAIEMGANVLLKATKVDGVYSDDPVKNTQAVLYEKLSYNEVIDQRLKVMDVSAIDLCQRNNVPILVFNLKKHGNMRRAVMGPEQVGTLIA